MTRPFDPLFVSLLDGVAGRGRGTEPVHQPLPRGPSTLQSLRQPFITARQAQIAVPQLVIVSDGRCSLAKPHGFPSIPARIAWRATVTTSLIHEEPSRSSFLFGSSMGLLSAAGASNRFISLSQTASAPGGSFGRKCSILWTIVAVRFGGTCGRTRQASIFSINGGLTRMEIFAVFRLMAADVGRCRTRALDDSGQRIGSAARPERSVTPPQATDGAVAVRSAQGQTSSIAGTGVNGRDA